MINLKGGKRDKRKRTKKEDMKRKERGKERRTGWSEATFPMGIPASLAYGEFFAFCTEFCIKPQCLVHSPDTNEPSLSGPPEF